MIPPHPPLPLKGGGLRRELSRTVGVGVRCLSHLTEEKYDG
jgi:hypothetical protein